MRIYADNPEHEIGFAAVPFVAGVGVVGPAADVTYFLDVARGYTVDYSKDHLEMWDGLTVAQIDAMITYLGGTPSANDSKYTKVRALETLISVKFIGSLTVASAAATAGVGKTKITVTSPGAYAYYIKTAPTTAPDILFGDKPGTGWALLTLTGGVNDEVSLNAAGDDKFTVVRVNAAGTVIALASGNVTVKAA